MAAAEGAQATLEGAGGLRAAILLRPVTVAEILTAFNGRLDIEPLRRKPASGLTEELEHHLQQRAQAGAEIFIVPAGGALRWARCFSSSFGQTRSWAMTVVQPTAGSYVLLNPETRIHPAA